jgi:hypothetical protein
MKACFFLCLIVLSRFGVITTNNSISHATKARNVNAMIHGTLSAAPFDHRLSTERLPLVCF